VQAAKMGFCEVHSVTLGKKVHSCEIHAEPLLWIVRCQLHWFGHVSTSMIPQKRLARQVLLIIPTGKWPRGHPRTRWSG